MSAFLTDLLEVSLGCGVVIALLLLLTPVLSKRFSPRWRYWAWLLIALRLALPGIPFDDAIPAPIQMETPQTITAPAYDGMEHDIKNALPYGYMAQVFGGTTYHVWYSDDQNNSIRAYDTPIFRLESHNSDWSLSFHWDGVWKLGLILCLGWQVYAYLSFRLRVKRWSTPADAEALAVLEAQKQALGVDSKIALVRCEIISSPLLMGFVRPTILLPAQLTGDALEPTLAHELTHFKRKDLWYKLLMVLVRSLHWFNPLVWLMARQAAQDVELCCDYDLLKKQGEEARRSYGQAILDQMAADHRISSLTTGFSGDKKSIFIRFWAIMDTSPKKKGTAAMALTLCAVALAGGLVACNQEPTAVEGGEVTVFLESQPNQTITANYYPEGFDWNYGALPTLTTYADNGNLTITLPEGVSGPVYLSMDSYHGPDENGHAKINKNTIPFELAEGENTISYSLLGLRNGNLDKMVCYLTWGKSSRFRYVFQVEPLPDPELTMTSFMEHYTAEADFTVSETEYDGRPYYLFEHTPSGISIRMPENCQEEASTVFFRGRSMTASLPCNPLSRYAHGNVGGIASFAAADLTGDGTKELVYIWGYGGTGVWEDQCMVFDLTTMEWLPISGLDENLLTENVQAELVEYRDIDGDTYAIFQITGPDASQGRCALLAQDTQQPPGPMELSFGGYVHISLSGNQLYMSTNFSPRGVAYPPGLSYLGSLTGRLVYSPSLRAFSLSPPFTMETLDLYGIEL